MRKETSQVVVAHADKIFMRLRQEDHNLRKIDFKESTHLGVRPVKSDLPDREEDCCSVKVKCGTELFFQ